MARKRKYLGIHVGLEDGDRRRLAELAAKSGRSQTEVAREAIRAYLDSEQGREDAERQGQIAKAIRHMEDRIAALIARSAIDVGTIYQVLWHRSDPNSRQKLFDAARNQAVDRLHRKLKNEELVIKQTLSEQARTDIEAK